MTILSLLSPQKPVTCALCANSNGFIYIDESDRDKGVRACRHEEELKLLGKPLV
jgi:hypothetical protein